MCDPCGGSPARREDGVLRCECGSLLARYVDGRLELKCRRCKRTVMVSLDGVGDDPVELDRAT